MQGAGNDFVVLDETRGPLGLTTAHYRFLADRHFGIGCDQILVVERPQTAGAGADFRYRIWNADGGEVEQCGNGARCFVRFVREQGLTAKDAVKVKTQGGVIELRMQPDGRVTVNMGAPVFELARIPFDPAGLVPDASAGAGAADAANANADADEAAAAASAASATATATATATDVWPQWPLALGVSGREPHALGQAHVPVQVAVVSMGNPHAVQIVADVDTAPVQETGALIEHHPAFPKRVNAGFMQIVSRSQIRLRVYERGAGETLACGTGACAAVVAGIRLGLLDSCVDVLTRGGQLTIEWSGALDAPVLMTGPATTVFAAEIDIPDAP